jgi:hypothetical protein
VRPQGASFWRRKPSPISSRWRLSRLRLRHFAWLEDTRSHGCQLQSRYSLRMTRDDLFVAILIGFGAEAGGLVPRLSPCVAQRQRRETFWAFVQKWTYRTGSKGDDLRRGRRTGFSVMMDYQASLEKLRSDAAEAALIRDRATDTNKAQFLRSALPALQPACRRSRASDDRWIRQRRITAGRAAAPRRECIARKLKTFQTSLGFYDLANRGSLDEDGARHGSSVLEPSSVTGPVVRWAK